MAQTPSAGCIMVDAIVMQSLAIVTAQWLFFRWHRNFLRIHCNWVNGEISHEIFHFPFNYGAEWEFRRDWKANNQNFSRNFWVKSRELFQRQWMNENLYDSRACWKNDFRLLASSERLREKVFITAAPFRLVRSLNFPTFPLFRCSLIRLTDNKKVLAATDENLIMAAMDCRIIELIKNLKSNLKLMQLSVGKFHVVHHPLWKCQQCSASPQHKSSLATPCLYQHHHDVVH